MEHVGSRLVALPIVVSLAGAGPAAQGIKLNAPLERVSIEGQTREFDASADGQWAVYKNLLDVQWTGETRLLSVRLDGGGGPNLLSSELHLASAFAFTPDGRQIVFKGANVPASARGLFRVPTDGSRTPERISPFYGPFAFDPTGTRVVFTDGATGAGGLYSAPLDGSSLPLLLSDADAFAAEIAPDGQRVVFLAPLPGAGPTELYSVPLDGSAGALRLHAPLSAAADVLDFRISADSRRVVYRADQDLDLAEELYSVPIDGSAAPVKLNSPLGVRTQEVREFRISPDGTRVVYRADQDVPGLIELFSVPIEGGLPIQLNPALPAAGDVDSFEIDPRGARVLYLADQTADQVVELHQVEIERRSEQRRVSAALVPGGDVLQFWIDARGERVVYRADQVVDGVYGLYGASLARADVPRELAASAGPEVQLAPGGRVVFALAPDLYSVSILGGTAPTRLNAPLVAGGSVRGDFRLVHAGATVLFRADADVAGMVELFRVPVAGGAAPARLNGPLNVEQILGRITAVQVSADGRRILYTERVGSSGDSTHDELFSRSLASAALPVPLFPTSPTYNDDVAVTLLTPDGSRVLFATGSDEGESYPELFSVPSDAHLTAQQLNQPSDSEEGVGTVLTTPDGSTVVYTEDGDSRGIWAAPLAGGAPPRLLSAGGTAGAPYRFQLDSAGTHVVYLEPLSPTTSNNAAELYRTPIDGSAPPTRLVDLALPHGNDFAFQLTPDGARVVYRTDQELDEALELFVVPSDGSMPPVKLSGAMVAGGDVQSFRLDPAGTRVVFLADRLVDGESELFSVPIDASTPPVALDDVPGLGRITREYEISADGRRVVHRTDLAAAGVFELWSVPIDGSAAAVRLNGALVPGGDVSLEQSWMVPAFRITPDGRRVVYVADQLEDERHELFGVPIDGSAPALVLSGPFVSGGGIAGAPALAPDGEHVVYVADQRSDETFELFAAPLGHAKRSVRLNPRLVPGGDVSAFGFVITPDARSVLYLADQETDGAVELFLSYLPGSTRAGTLRR